MMVKYPISIFDSCIEGGNPMTCERIVFNPQMIGLKLERGDQIKEFEDGETSIAPYDIKSMKQYSSAVMNLMMETINRRTSNLANEK